MAIVIVRRLDGHLPMRWRSHAHHMEALPAWASEQTNVRVEDVECKNTVRFQVAPHGGKESRKLILLAQVKKRIAGNENHRELPPKVEFPHVSFDELYSRIGGNRTTVRRQTHL